MTDRPLDRIVRDYLERVVNQRDVTAVDDLVAADYQGFGHGWPADVDALRQFYIRQAEFWPDWRIHVQETMELNYVFVHAMRAKKLGLQLDRIDYSVPGELDGAIARAKGGALVVLGDPMIGANRGRVIELTLRYQVPSTFGPRWLADEGA